MSVISLVRARTLLGSHLEGDTPPILDPKGSIADNRHISDTFGLREALPRFVRIEITDAELADIDYTTQEWVRAIDWAVLSSNQALDSYRLDIQATNPGSGDGNLQADLIEQQLLRWNGKIISATNNSTIVDMTIFDAIKSPAFWGNDAVNAISFAETNYNSATGIHTIQANFTALGIQARTVDRRVRNLGGSVINLNNGIITFTISRMSIINKFKQDIKSQGERSIRPRRYRLSNTLVDEAIANNGNLSIDLITFNANLIDDSQ